MVGVKILSKESIEDLLSSVDSFAKEEALVYGNKSTRQKDYSKRKTTRVGTHHSMFPEACQEIEAHVNDGSRVAQFDILIYNIGGKFTRHRDESRKISETRQRKWSTITLLDKSDDLIGGDLVVFDDKDDEVGRVIDLKVGETVVFDSRTVYHEVTEVTQGQRISLVAWLKDA